MAAERRKREQKRRVKVKTAGRGSEKKLCYRNFRPFSSFFSPIYSNL